MTRLFSLAKVLLVAVAASLTLLYVADDLALRYRLRRGAALEAVVVYPAGGSTSPNRSGGLAPIDGGARLLRAQRNALTARAVRRKIGRTEHGTGGGS